MVAKQTGIILTERDINLLTSIYKYRDLSTSQVQRLYFPSMQTANRRIRLLVQAEYILSFQVPGVSERLVTLADKGAEAVAENLLIPLPELGLSSGRKKPKDYYFLKHFLAQSDFRIALTQACDKRTDVELLGFIPEHLASKSSAGGGLQRYIRAVTSDIDRPRGKIAHTPDGVFALKKNNKAALFFLEIDRGTEVLSHPERGFLKTIRFYLNYLVNDGYHRYQRDFQIEEPFKAFRVLIVTTSPKRLENIRKVGGHFRFEPNHAKRFLWLTTEEAISKERVFSPLWSSLDPEDKKPYSLVSST